MSGKRITIYRHKAFNVIEFLEKHNLTVSVQEYGIHETFVAYLNECFMSHLEIHNGRTCWIHGDAEDSFSRAIESLFKYYIQGKTFFKLMPDCNPLKIEAPKKFDIKGMSFLEYCDVVDI